MKRGLLSVFGRIFFLALLILPCPVHGQEYLVDRAKPFPPPEFFDRLAPGYLETEKNFQANLSALFTHYPDFCRGVKIGQDKEIYLIMANGVLLRYDDHRPKSFDERLENPDIEDMFSQVYPLGPAADVFKPDYDPGRFRVDEFFKAVYGNTAAATRANLTRVKFCGQTVSFNRQNGAAEALERVGRELAALLAASPELKAWVFPLAGTFNWRVIAGTDRLSPHSWATAIDLNAKKGGYWRWSKNIKGQGIVDLKKNYPFQIVEIFEKNGFIWGGRWSHFDLMHFEYRPELIHYPYR